MRIDDLERRLRAALSGSLPGPAAQYRMAARPRGGGPPGAAVRGERRGAVLVLLYPDGAGQARLVLTRRRADLPDHSGQVSFPGGRMEDGESVEDAALREGREEAGIDPARVSVLGRLTPLPIPVSGYVVHPVVAIAPTRPDLERNDAEVERILEVPVGRLTEPARIGVGAHPTRGARARVPFFDLDGEVVWGATAMILAELLALIGKSPDPWSGSTPG